MSLNTLNDQLVHASKKFAKACDQIKILKQRIAELLRMFSYCDPSLASNNNNNINNYNTNTNNYTNNTTSNNNSNINNNNNSNYINPNSTSTQTSETTTTSTTTNSNTFNASVFKDTIRQQIETLQSVKTAYFMYAQKKADEITRLQCELYGEDAVRLAYENASPDVLVSASDAGQASISQQEEIGHQEQTQNESNNNNNNDLLVATRSTNIDQRELINNDNDETSYGQTLTTSDSTQRSSSIGDNSEQQTYWTPWNFNVNPIETPMNDRMQFRQANTSNSQVQLIEYDFLTA